MKRILAIAATVCLWAAGDALAREVRVQDVAGLQQALDSAMPGDVVVLKDGVWKDAAVDVKKGGAAGKAVTVRAETPGGVSLEGASHLEIAAPWVDVEGLLFTKGSIQHGYVIWVHSDHDVVRDCAVVDYNPAKFETGYYWLFFSGNDNLAERCFFKGKSNMQPVVGNDLEGARHNTVRRCYFKDVPYNEANGREILRIWGSGKYEHAAGDGAFFTIEENLFDHADGEGSEIISLKSDRNLVIHNTIRGTRGGINIRQGQYNTIKENAIFGDGVERAMGVRVSGAHNVVEGNYVEGCRYGYQVSCGEYIREALTPGYRPNVPTKGTAVAGTVVATYAPVKDLLLKRNVAVGNRGPDLVIGPDYKHHWPEMQLVLLPEECVFEGNRFVRPEGGVSVKVTLPEKEKPLDRFSFEPNRFEGNVLVGGTDADEASRGECREEALPAGWTEGQEKPKFVVLTPADVGPAWIRGRGW
ncbi:MAG: polysaccharide lyase 6 family protein [Phycisphaerae bacterium]